MTQFQYNIKEFKSVGNHYVPEFYSMPEEFKKCWIQISKLNLKNTKYAACFYFNQDFPEGTVIVSESIRSSYPDIYVTFDHNNKAERLYINPVMRKRGYLPIAGLVLRSCFYNYLGIIVDGSSDRSFSADKAYSKAKGIVKETPAKNNPEINLSSNAKYEIDPPRDPIYPNVWNIQRVGGNRG